MGVGHVLLAQRVEVAAPWNYLVFVILQLPAAIAIAWLVVMCVRQRATRAEIVMLAVFAAAGVGWSIWLWTR